MGGRRVKDAVWRLKCVMPFRILAATALIGIGVVGHFIQTQYYDYYHNIIAGLIFILVSLIGFCGSVCQYRCLLMLHIVLSALCCLLLYPANIGLSVVEMWCDMGSDKCQCRVDHCDKASRRKALGVEIGSILFASILLLLNMIAAVNTYYVWRKQRPGGVDSSISHKVETLIRAVTPSTHVFLNARLARLARQTDTADSNQPLETQEMHVQTLHTNAASCSSNTNNNEDTDSSSSQQNQS